ncbi:hypothetical protein HMPREF0653_00599 [Prevotella disiens JCM 6334 = ATCC 29426]|uniref:Uncharacterized protein n=1 Tax=Prevotella disiens JCM 6334 = ATCC 29426 TaxID=1235811 RepID=A0ABN0NUA7_9BACT|nr:hypothetical protein HMPREF0653_00599 [Prevotella disiens JCM 6334 = ATCC 29426]
MTYCFFFYFLLVYYPNCKPLLCLLLGGIYSISLLVFLRFLDEERNKSLPYERQSYGNIFG